jgi:alpha-ketoglutarate-dependent 2,4-dichlorophenoxyacetate dioxygenase
MNTTPLHRDFGVEIHGLNLKDATADHLYPQIRAAFEEHSLLLFRGQDWTDEDILRFGVLWGEIENRTDGPVHVPKVSNVKADGSVLLPDALRLKDLQANMLWHTDSTFLPVPALANIITARVVPSGEGAAELVSTRAGFRRLDAALQDILRGALLRHRLTHSRAKIDPELTKLDYITKWDDQLWPAIWPNPVTGAEGVLHRQPCLRDRGDGGRPGSGADRRGHCRADPGGRDLRAPMAGRRRADLGRTRNPAPWHALAL